MGQNWAPHARFLNHWVQRLTRLLASHHWIFFCSGTLEILERSRSCLKNVFPVDGAGSVMKLWSHQASKKSRPRSSRNFPDFDFKIWSLNALYLASTRILPWPLRTPSSLTKFSRLWDSLTPRFLDLVQSRHVGKLGQFWCYASLRKQMKTWSNTSVIPSPLPRVSYRRSHPLCSAPAPRARTPVAARRRARCADGRGWLQPWLRKISGLQQLLLIDLSNLSIKTGILPSNMWWF